MKRQASNDSLHQDIQGVRRDLRGLTKVLSLLNRSLTQTRGNAQPHKHAKSKSRLIKDEKARALIVKLLRQGCSYTEIVEQLKKRVNFSTSHAAVGRFARALILEQLPESRLW